MKNEGLRPLYERAVRDLRGFDGWRMVHVRREFNARADQLANLAMDARRDVVEYDFAPAPTDKGDKPARQASRPRPTEVNATIRCSQAPDPSVCPAPCKSGWSASIKSTTPAGLCIHAASVVFEHVHATAQTGRSQAVTCPMSGCGGRFGIELT